MQNPESRIQNEGQRCLSLRQVACRLCILHSAFCILSSSTGCHSANNDPNAGLKATHVDPDTAKFSYWLNQPPVASADFNDFDRLWRACRRATEGASFTIDRVDFREGRLTTLPLVSKAAFMFWRNDVASAADAAEGMLSTIRRTVRWDITKQEDGSFRATPSVVIERYAMTERRLTSAMQYQEIFSDEHKVEGSRAQDEGLAPVDVYWYATGRDRNLEKRLAGTVRSLLPLPEPVVSLPNHTPGRGQGEGLAQGLG
jgi:hypothetical protein